MNALARSLFALAVASAPALHTPAMHAAAQEHAHDHSQAPAPAPPASVTVPLDADARAALPRETAEASAHGRSLRCEGVSLTALLRSAGIMPDAPLRGPQLARYVLVTARDGYRAVFSLAELDPTLGGAQVYVVDHCNGAPLDEESGPLRLLVPGDSRPARGVRQVESIVVETARPNPEARP